MSLSMFVLLGAESGCDFPASQGEAGTDSDASSGGNNGDSDDDDAIPTGDGESDGGEPVYGECGDEDLPVVHHFGVLTEPQTWGPAIHVLDGFVAVTAGLIVEPCARIELAANAALDVFGGAASLSGTADGPIVITSASDNPQPGDWGSLRFDSTTVELRHTLVEFGGGTGDGAVEIAYGTTASVTDCTIRGSGGVGMHITGAAEIVEFAGNTVVDNVGRPLVVPAEQAGQIGPGTYAPNETPGIQLLGSDVESDQTWLAHDTPWVSLGGFSLRNAGGSAHLTMAPGSELQLGANASLTVDTGGALSLAGTPRDPIRVTSLTSAKASGDWGAIDFLGTSVGPLNEIRHSVLEYGGEDDRGIVRLHPDASVAISDTTVMASAGFGIQAADGATLREFDGNVLVDNEDGPLAISAEHVATLGAGTYAPNVVEGIYVRHSVLDHDATWIPLGIPINAPSGFDIRTAAGTARLVVDPGFEIGLGDGARIDIGDNGALALVGTASAPVRVRSMKEPGAGGDWDHIHVRSGSIGAHNSWSNAIIEHGGGHFFGQVWVETNAELTLDDVTFGVAGDGCDIEQSGLVTATDSPYTPCE